MQQKPGLSPSSFAGTIRTLRPYARAVHQQPRLTKAAVVDNRTGSSAAELSAAWEEHLKHEFLTKNTEETIKTMVPHASVNHVPTLTGGKGHEELRRFYSQSFIPAFPADTKTTPVHRVIGSSAIVDEMIVEFTHDQDVAFMLPGVAPTHKRVSIPLIVVVTFEGDKPHKADQMLGRLREGLRLVETRIANFSNDLKLASERIYWDQASVLVQLGLLDPKMLPGKPVSGAEQAAKVRDFDSVPSNRALEMAYDRC